MPLQSLPLRFINPVTPGIPPIITIIFGGFFLGVIYIGAIGGSGLLDYSNAPTAVVTAQDMYNFLFDMEHILRKLVRAETSQLSDFQFIYNKLVEYRYVIANNLNQHLPLYDIIIDCMKEAFNEIEKAEELDMSQFRDTQAALYKMMGELHQRG